MITWVVFTCGRDKECLKVFLEQTVPLYNDCNFVISEDSNDPLLEDFDLPKLSHTWLPPLKRIASVLRVLREAQVLTQSEYVGKMDCDTVHFSREWLDTALLTSPGAIGLAAPSKYGRRYLYGMCYLIHKDVLQKVDQVGGSITVNSLSWEDMHMSERLNNVYPELPVLTHNPAQYPKIYGGAKNTKVTDYAKLRTSYQVLHCGEIGRRGDAKNVAHLMKKAINATS